MSPPPMTATPLSKQLQKSGGPKSLLDIWLQRSAPKERRPEFHGRLTTDGPKAKLYPNFKDPNWEHREAMLEA